MIACKRHLAMIHKLMPAQEVVEYLGIKHSGDTCTSDPKPIPVPSPENEEYFEPTWSPIARCPMDLWSEQIPSA